MKSNINYWSFETDSLSLKSSLAIILIIVFSSLVMIDKKSKNVQKNNWLAYSLIAFLCFGLLALSSKYILNMGVTVFARLIYTMLIVVIFILNDIKKANIKVFNLLNKNYLLLLCIGILSASFNYFMQTSYIYAPNVGYINAINAASTSLVAIFSIILFRDEFSIRKMIGVIGVTSGLLLLIL